MSINKTYAVFGLGRYGTAVARGLIAMGAEVLVVDIDEAQINSAIAEFPFCKCADVTDPEVIKQLDVANMDTVIVAMADSLEASVMAVMLCKEAGVRQVIVKCANEMHAKIMERVGADRVVLPENESGTRLAKSLLSGGFIDMIDISGDISVVDVNVRPEWVGKTLIELNLRKKYSVNVIAIRKGAVAQIDIDPAMKLTDDMKLIVIANAAALKRLKA
jgi:trk system potassium uptake protein TrkA